MQEYVQSRNLSGHALEQFLLLNNVWTILDEACDLDHTGITGSISKDYDRNIENMVGLPGYQALADYLASNVSITLNSTVRTIAYGPAGVQVTTEAGEVIAGSLVVSTVSMGVLAHDDIQFEPRLPPWKYRCANDLKMGLLEKMFLVFDHVWWPQQDAFWRVRDGQLFGKQTANEWYNVHNLPGITAPVLLTTPAGYQAKVDASSRSCLSSPTCRTLPYIPPPPPPPRFFYPTPHSSFPPLTPFPLPPYSPD